MVKKTKKYGGDIFNKNPLEHILSIGYELESDSLSKFILDEKDTLINTDIIRYFLLESNTINNTNEIEEKEVEIGNIEQYKMLKINFINLDEDEMNEYEELSVNYEELGLEELEEKQKELKENIDEINEYLKIREIEIKNIEIPLTIQTNDLYYDKKDVLFQITNDISKTPFTKYLKNQVNLTEDSELIDFNLNIKNSLYKFKTTEQKEYPLNFSYSSNTPNNSFSFVEWIFTYYKIKSNKNIIIISFINLLKNLFTHLDSLTPQHGKLIMNLKGNEIIIPNPENRILYNIPDTPIYYLQTDFFNTPSLNIDDVCIVPQMTIGVNIINVIDVLKELTTNSINSIPMLNSKLTNIFQIIERINNIINELIESYNKTNVYKINENKNSITNYLFLFLYKLFTYYNKYLTTTKQSYFKNMMPINCRHTNYDIYIKLKSEIMEHFSINDDLAIQIITKILCQPIILLQLLDNNTNVRKNAFLSTNTIPISNKNYGDPYYSLVSYLDCFNNSPYILEEDSTEENKSNYYDWLIIKDIDNLTSTYPIKDIILIEIRFFANLISIFLYSIENQYLKKMMKEGICNKKVGKTEEINGLSVLMLREFVRIHDTAGITQEKLSGGEKRIKYKKTLKIKQKKNKTKKIKKQKK